MCELSGDSWVPKDCEARRLDVKPECIDYLREERQRQESEGILGPFVLLAGTCKNTSAEGRLKPVYPDSPSKSFAKMIRDEGMDPAITVRERRS